jgi:hypothetical protein
MQIDIRAYLDNLLKSHSISKNSADCIYQEYLRIKDDYLAGKLHKSTLQSFNEIRAEEQKSRIRQRGDLPTIEDMALFTIAKNICDNVRKA